MTGSLVSVRIIMELMTEEQLDRYEAFRRSAIDKLKIKRVRIHVLAGDSWKSTCQHLMLTC